MFTDTMARWSQAITNVKDRFTLVRLFYPLFDRFTSLVLATAGLVQNTATAKIGAADCYVFATGILVKIANGTTMPALVGTVINGTFNVFCFFCDNGGNLTVAMGTAGSSLAKVVLPQLPEGKAMLGFVIVNPTGTGNFIGGTTSLSDGTVVPNAAYISPLGSYDPFALTGLASTP